MATAVASIGDNNPPEPINTAYEAIKLDIDDLFETAQGFLDGDPIANQETADLVNKLIDDARKARAAAEAQRKLEAKPFDDGKAAVQALWTPLTDEKKGRCALIIDTAKRALTPWLNKLEEEKREIARKAREEADAKAAEARAALQASIDLEARERAEALLEEAKKAEKVATKAENSKAHAKGGEGRATGLTSVWHTTLTDPVEALKHYRATQPNELKEFLLSLAEKDVYRGARQIPGFEIIEQRVAR